MFFITKPSAIRFHSNLAIFCYNCPDCKLRLTKRVRSGKLLKMFSNLFALKKYVCDECRKKHYVHVKTYSTQALPGQVKHRLDVLDNNVIEPETIFQKPGLLEKTYRMPLIYKS